MAHLTDINGFPIIRPNWSVPNNVHAYTTTRLGGVSPAPFDTFNLSVSSAAPKHYAEENRALLTQALMLPEPPRWLAQTHSTIALDTASFDHCLEGDASYALQANHVCAVMTADCLPLLVCNQAGTKVAAIHAGWRGLLNGVIEAALIKLDEPPAQLFIWLGPAISQTAFEVGPEVYSAFTHKDALAQAAFIPASRPDHYYADLYALARMRLQKAGLPLTNISGGDYCTFNQPQWFYSYRRDHVYSGRMASLIWFS